jgi:hypothetical protein
MSRSEARSVLLSALDQIDNIKERDGEARNVYLVCAYAYQVEGQTTFGWTTTDDPSFVTASLLRTVADNLEFDEPRREVED